MVNKDLGKILKIYSAKSRGPVLDYRREKEILFEILEEDGKSYDEFKGKIETEWEEFKKKISTG